MFAKLLVRRTFLALLPLVACCCLAFAARADDWTPPKDELFTEKQLENYIAAQKDWMQLLKAYGKAVEGSKTGFGVAAAVAGMEDKQAENLKKHGLAKAEYDWINNKAFECVGVAFLDEQFDAGAKDLAERKQKNAAEIEAGKKKVAEYEQATKANTRVLTKEQREDLVKSAKSDQASAEDEAKQHAQEAKDAGDEAAKYEADAKAADALAKKPPADVDADSRADYVKGKQEEAETARNSAKESRDKEKEAKKQEAESKAKAAAFAKAAANPEVPVIDDEKAQVKKDNEEGLAKAKDDLQTAVQATDLLKDAEAQMNKQIAEFHKPVKEPNLALVKKHFAEIKAAVGIEDKK